MDWVWWLMPVIPALWEAKVGRSPEVGSLRLAWPTWRNSVSTKKYTISQVWWHIPVIPATGKLRQENHLNRGVGSCSELRSWHCTPAWVTRAKLPLKKKENCSERAPWPGQSFGHPAIFPTSTANFFRKCAEKSPSFLTRGTECFSLILRRGLGSHTKNKLPCVRNSLTQSRAQIYVFVPGAVYGETEVS